MFLGHGLIVAIFIALATTATAYLARRRIPVFGVSSYFWLAYLFVMLALCRSLGASVLAIMAVFLVIFVQRRSLQLACASVALVVLAYPALRGADMVPVQVIADQVAKYSGDRSASFQMRIDNEDRLLARANQRPWFGWGGYGRNRVFDEITGKDLSITDGTWIIIVGSEGWIGYFATFGLLCVPIVQSARSQVNRSFSSIATSLMLALNLFDLLPNSSIGPLTWLMAGSVLPILLRRGPHHSNQVRPLAMREAK